MSEENSYPPALTSRPTQTSKSLLQDLQQANPQHLKQTNLNTTRVDQLEDQLTDLKEQHEDLLRKYEKLANQFSEMRDNSSFVRDNLDLECHPRVL